MTKEKLLTIAVLGLLAINITLVTVFVFRKPPHPLPPPPPINTMHPNAPRELKDIVIEKLELTEKQIEQYEDLIKIHRNTIQQKDSTLFVAKTALYATISSNNIAAKDSLLNKINVLQKEIEDVHYKHFAAVKALCTPNQLAQFVNLTQDFAQAFKPKQRPAHPPIQSHHED